jgi:hypothetical protein
LSTVVVIVESGLKFDFGVEGRIIILRARVRFRCSRSYYLFCERSSSSLVSTVVEIVESSLEIVESSLEIVFGFGARLRLFAGFVVFTSGAIRLTQQ